MNLSPKSFPAILLLALSATASSHALSSAPSPGAFGFDWLQPETARCVPLAKNVLKSFRSCERNPEGTFGLRDPAFKCRRSENSEYFVYESKAACSRNLETMQANAP